MASDEVKSSINAPANDPDTPPSGEGRQDDDPSAAKGKKLCNDSRMDSFASASTYADNRACSFASSAAMSSALDGFDFGEQESPRKLDESHIDLDSETKEKLLQMAGAGQGAVLSPFQNKATDELHDDQLRHQNVSIITSGLPFSSRNVEPSPHGMFVTPTSPPTYYNQMTPTGWKDDSSGSSRRSYTVSSGSPSVANVQTTRSTVSGLGTHSSTPMPSQSMDRQQLQMARPSVQRSSINSVSTAGSQPQNRYQSAHARNVSSEAHGIHRTYNVIRPASSSLMKPGVVTNPTGRNVSVGSYTSRKTAPNTSTAPLHTCSAGVVHTSSQTPSGQQQPQVDTMESTETSNYPLHQGRRVLREEVTEREIKVPTRRLVEDTIEKVMIIPEVVRREEIIEETKLIREKIIEIAKPIYHERIVEVPEYEYVDKIVEVPHTIYQEKIREVPKVEYVEHTTFVPKIVQEERIVEVPEVELREYPVERIVEVPEVREEIVIREVPVPRYVEVPVPEYIDVEIIENVERNVPVPVESVTTVVHKMAKLKTRYEKVPLPIYAPRFIEVAVPMEQLDEESRAAAETLIHQVSLVASHGFPSLCEVEDMAMAVKNFVPNVESDPDKIKLRLAEKIRGL